ncbi:hypothetical protein GCM10009530_38560 [Microbispora corallina]|uniref:SnoaL-like domain-containing protein n=1 Tax=Microbispora corallina TaxID=83302 RepID=A0ABQ4G2M5_9ACTN|nr:nuclear transport factor 2 family protein [Microbispora corallina]GIH41304.1 hypothetical protein Mco01_43040 [Microbispora corallina]
MPDLPEVTDAMIGAFNAHDLKAALLCYTPGAVYVSPSGMGEGRDEIASFLGAFLTGFPDVRVTPWSTLVLDDLVVIEWTLTGTHEGPFLMPGGEVLPATGRCVGIRGCGARTMDRHLIAAHRVFYDQLELYAQLGAELAPETP